MPGFKEVVEDKTESFVLVDGQLVPKGKPATKLQDSVAKPTAPALPEVKATPIKDDGTALGKLKARKAVAQEEQAKLRSRKRVQEITKTEAAKVVKIGSYEELSSLVEEAADMYPACDFDIAKETINYVTNGQQKTAERYLIGVTKGDRRRQTSIRADEVTFEALLQYLDEASN